MTLSESTLLQSGKYRIVRLLGQGGFGITYLAEHTILNIRVCIKEFYPVDYVDRDEISMLVHSATTGNREFVDRLKQRFISEARNIYQLNHPGIIRISDIFEENGTAYYVMDYIEGKSLGDLVKEKGALPEPMALEYSVKIAEALEYIHRHNMMHLDLKPDNIMLRSSDNMPVIIDFGLSKQYNSSGHAQTSIIVGVSKGYSPMEQYSEEALTTFSPRIDVYSLGATAYTLFTGRIPPEARLLIRETIKLPVTVSPTVVKAIQWAMRPFPEERCPSARDFISFLASGERYGQNQISVSEQSEITQPYGELLQPNSTVALPPVSPVVADGIDQSRIQPPKPSRRRNKNRKGSKFFKNLFLLMVGVLLFFFVLLFLIGVLADTPAGSDNKTSDDAFSSPSEMVYEEINSMEEVVVDSDANVAPVAEEKDAENVEIDTAEVE